MSGFPNGNGGGPVLLTHTRLLAAAACAGSITPLTGRGRPVSELIWRTSMIDMALESRGGRWRRTEAYGRLDGSEKSSLSYFLGMAQAAMLGPLALGVSYLVHVDAVTQIVFGATLRRRRPDLIGFSPNVVQGNLLGTGRVVVEAKGRSNGFDQAACDSALKQLGKCGNPPQLLLPLHIQMLLNQSSHGVASVSHFDPHSLEWGAYLEDPYLDIPDDVPVLDDDEFEAVVAVAHAREILAPIVSLAQFVPQAVRRTDEGWTIATVPEADIEIAVPMELWLARDDLFQLVPEDGPDGPLAVRPEAVERAMRIAARAVRPEAAEARPLPDGWDEAGRWLGAAVRPVPGRGEQG